MQHPNDDAARRRYEAAVLAALDFEPAEDPFAGPAPRRRSRRTLTRAVLLALAHVVFAVLFAHAMSAGDGGTPLLVTGVGWATCTVLLGRMVWRAGGRLLRPLV